MARLSMHSEGRTEGRRAWDTSEPRNNPPTWIPLPISSLSHSSLGVACHLDTMGDSHRRRDSRSRSPDRDHSSSSRRHHRSRSRSPRRSSHRSRGDDDESRTHKDKDRRDRRSHRDRDDRSDDEGDSGPPEGVDDLSDDDYFLKATELKLWLYEEKGKKLDSLKTEDARRYFRRFVRAWNKGRLDGTSFSRDPSLLCALSQHD